MALMPKPFPQWSTYKGHGGIDFPKSSGSAIPAITNGTITYSGWWNDNAGNTKTITRDDGLKIMYCHLVNLNGAGVGTRVVVGQTVGYVGSTGRSTGPHLHLEMWLNGVAQDEWRWMDQNATVGLGGSPAGGVGGDWNDVQRQQFLVSIGLDTGGVGNGWGPMSEAATKTFQSWVGLTNDGLFGPATIAVAKTIQQGGKRVEGRSTSEIQQFLTSKGIGVGPIDNQWGPKTSLGTFVYQRSVGFLPDALWGEQTDAKAFPPPPPQTTYPTDGRNASSRPTKDIQQFLISRGYDLGPTGADNDYGPATSVATAKFQEANKLTVDGSWGPQTDAKAVELGGFPNNGPNPVPEGDEASHTPNLVSPTAADFPVWIRFEEKLDQQYVASAATWNTDSFKHYKTQYNPIESHTHWWNEPGKGGTHDGNVDYLNRTKDVSANFVVSAGRVTLTVPLNKNALTTGGRNPYAWKSENDPLMTTSSSDLGYKTMGYLHYIVEKLNPTLQGESIRLHKEFYSTSCSLIDTQKVRAYAEKFRTGELDPATGLPPEPEPEPENETKKEIYEHLEQIARLVDEL